MPNIKALRQRLAELAHDGRDIGEALRPGAKYSPRNVTISKLVSLIHKAKPKRNSLAVAPNKFLRMQLCSRVNYCDFDLHVGARIDELGQCWLVVFDTSAGGRVDRHFKVPANWKAESLRRGGSQKFLLLAKSYARSVPLGTVYSVRYISPDVVIESRSYAVQAETGGALRLILNIQHATEVAEELYRARFAELAGM